jgi:hypothetical protein
VLEVRIMYIGFDPRRVPNDLSNHMLASHPDKSS